MAVRLQTHHVRHSALPPPATRPLRQPPLLLCGDQMGYPDNDRKHDRVGPKPSTFSGYRALDFVLSNPGYIDKTLLFTVRVVRVDKPGDRASRSKK